MSNQPPEHEHRWSNERSVEVKVMTVTAVTFARGQGCCELATYRMVTAYYDGEGNLLFEDDPERGLPNRIAVA